jgi:hypothetical protein
MAVQMVFEHLMGTRHAQHPLASAQRTAYSMRER